MKIITLTTDFGVRDWFVGTMKGVILGLCPQASIVDITHEIPPGDIRSGAFALAAGYAWFPKDTVHVAVVDPGVGSSRPAIVIRTQNYFLVGPDNGVLSFAVRTESVKSVRRLENQKYFLQPVSRTFHGRDIFAPVAGRLCAGFPIQKLGAAAPEFVHLRWPEPTVGSNIIRGEIVYIDRFGNMITNVGQDQFRSASAARLQFKTRNTATMIAQGGHYQAVPAGMLVLLIGSSGLLEISVNAGSAAEKLKLHVGDSFTISPAPQARIRSNPQ